MREQLAAAVDDLREHRGPWLEWTRDVRRPDGIIALGYPTLAEPARDAMRVLYEHGIVVFDWMNWREGSDLLATLTPERVATLDLHTTLMLLTAVARDDRFSEGSWGELFESGKGLWLFERWLELTRPEAA